MAGRVGLVSYADDPDGLVFRSVMLDENDPDEELDNPRWVVEGVDPERPVQMDKIGIVAAKGQAMIEKIFNLGEGLEQFAPEQAVVSETVIVQPGEKTWKAPAKLVEAMALEVSGRE